ncbi:rRNA maturation RNase YbeY [Hyphococcus luteus]|uniref:Endoribonuclease YbeY n=1 Tax=Hyphococcus luteus TaxID=2058213 RepID=A0A2S7K791_9PROT|nr:rRNA maturation RNase YbeY [Marinicaulis flavus]PQA88385.1 rRNA maturation RNase YbeY [Marinicaulis flavus]
MIESLVEDEGWFEALPGLEGLVGDCLSAAASAEPALDREIALLFCDDAAIMELNSRFRGKDRPTNVLSFPSGQEKGFLGDIAIARETCLAEAADKNIPLRDHAAHLIIHGMLHLIGYDHETEGEAAVMERREAEILRAMGIAHPYGGE